MLETAIRMISSLRQGLEPLFIQNAKRVELFGAVLHRPWTHINLPSAFSRRCGSEQFSGCPETKETVGYIRNARSDDNQP
jgi:hypothetical protein